MTSDVVLREAVDSRGFSSRSTLIETLLVIGLFAFGIAVGVSSARNFRGSLSYQDKFGPAVMVASGRGFVNPVVEPGSALDEFLAGRRSSLEVRDVAGVRSVPPEQFHEAVRYLLLSVGYGWRFTGISWAAVSNVGAVLCGLVTIACYAIGRLCLSRPLSALGAALFAVSPVHFAQIPQVRDYAKAPFILFAIPLILAIAIGQLPRRSLVLLSALCGAVVGIGVGFRMDVLIMAPIFVISVVCFKSRWPWTGLRDKALAIAVFGIALWLAAAPVLLRLSGGGSNAFHVILLGYSDPFDAGLGTRPSVYSFLPFYSDVYVARVVQEWAGRFSTQPAPYLSPAYDAASRAYWMQIVRHFPADIVTRTLGAVNGILNLPFNQPGGLFGPLSTLNGWGVALGAVLIGVASMDSVRVGVFVAWLVVALTGYSSFQFQTRHFFHLEIIPIVGALLVIELGVRRRLPTRAQFVRVATAVTVLVVATVASLAVLRAYQDAHLRRLFQQYVDSDKHEVNASFAETEHGMWRVSWDESGAATRTPPADYYVVELNGAPGRRLGWFSLWFDDVLPDYSRIASTWSESSVDRIFVPAYDERALRTFKGLELSPGLRDRLRGIYRIDHPERLPLLLTLTLRDGWQRRGLHQTLLAEPAGEPETISLVGDAASVPASRPMWVDHLGDAAVRPNRSAVAAAYTPEARVSDTSIEMDAVARDRSTYLVGFKPIDIQAPAALLVQGRLDAGGLSFGVLKDQRWYRQVVVRERGEFVAVVNLPDAGTYAPLITNGATQDGERTRFVLSRFGVVRGGR